MLSIDEAAPGSKADLLRSLRRTSVDYGSAPEAGRRIVLRFHSSVERVSGEQAVAGVRLDDGTEVEAGLLVTSIGYGGHPVEGLPFDPATGTVPNDHGRIDGVPGAYAVGWFKRGSSGGIGDNRTDAADTIRTLLDDAVAGRLPDGKRGSKQFARLVDRSHRDVLDADALRRVLDAERDRGRDAGRPAAKFATTAELVKAGRKRRF